MFGVGGGGGFFFERPTFDVGGGGGGDITSLESGSLIFTKLTTDLH